MPIILFLGFNRLFYPLLFETLLNIFDYTFNTLKRSALTGTIAVVILQLAACYVHAKQTEPPDSLGYPLITKENSSSFFRNAVWTYSSEMPEAIQKEKSLFSEDYVTGNTLNKILEREGYSDYGWLETRFWVDSSLAGKPLNLEYNNFEATNVWLNGTLILKAGQPSKVANEEVLPDFINPELAGIILDEGLNTLLVEFSTFNRIKFLWEGSIFDQGLNLSLKLQTDYPSRRLRGIIFGGTSLLLLLLLVIHLFLTYKSANDYHIYVALCTLFTLVHNFTTLSDTFFNWTYDYAHFVMVSFPSSYLLAFYFYILSIRKILRLSTPILTVNVFILILVSTAIYSSLTGRITFMFYTLVVATFLFLGASIWSFIEVKIKNRTVKIGVLALGLLITCFGAISYTLVYILFGIRIEFLFFISILLSYSGIPVSLTWYVVQGYSDLLNTLEQKIIERTEELEASVKVKTDFLSNISHEFITPLTICMNILHLSKQKSTPKHQIKQDLLVIENNLDRLHNMVQQLLELTKSDQSQLKLNKQIFNAGVFYKEIIEEFRSVIKAKNISLDTRWQKGTLLIHADKNRIQVILSNLISNAIKFTPQGGKIVIYTEEKDNHIFFSIFDTGRGIPKGFEELIFDRFHRIQQQDVEYVEGTGIGLELSRTIARLHNGDIIADPNQKKGALFHFYLPIVNSVLLLDSPNEENVDDLPKNEFESTGITAIKQRHTILLVEDNTDMQQTLKRILEPVGQVFIAENGSIAISILEKVKPDIIISDIMMPVMNGTELVKELMNDPNWNKIPILMLTAKNLGEEKTELLKLGVIDYITKPFNPGHFLSKIENLLRLYQNRQKNEFKYTDSSNIEDLELHKKVGEYVYNNISDTSINIELIADHFLQSRRTLFRIIEAETGMTPGEFIRELRLQKALELVQSKKNYRLKELMVAVGYKTPNGFKRAFYKRFGFHPTKK